MKLRKDCSRGEQEVSISTSTTCLGTDAASFPLVQTGRGSAGTENFTCIVLSHAIILSMVGYLCAGDLLHAVKRAPQSSI